jgi:hopene-associated glycosyltransferase HpnB
MVAAAALAGWIYLALLHGRFWRVGPLLHTPPAGVDQPLRNIVAIIPARDEAATIAAAVRSLDSPEVLRVIVVDDSSSDATAEIARSCGATVVNAGPLAAGWTGKLWAMSRGIAAAPSCDYLLFTDADIVHGPDSLRRLVAIAETDGYDLVSLMVKLRCRSTAEKLLLPAFVFFFFMLYPPAWIRRRGRRIAGAAGGCVLIRPSALRRAGGIEAIRSELIDDCALAAAVKRSGGSVWLGLSRETSSLRAYPRFVRHMIARTAFTQLRYSYLWLAGTAAGLLLLYAVPPIECLRGSAAATAAWTIMTLLYLPVVSFYGLSPVYALTLPFVALFYLAATLESALLYSTGRGGAWKGRHQAHGAE